MRQKFLINICVFIVLGSFCYAFYVRNSDATKKYTENDLKFYQALCITKELTNSKEMIIDDIPDWICNSDNVIATINHRDHFFVLEKTYDTFCELNKEGYKNSDLYASYILIHLGKTHQGIDSLFKAMPEKKYNKYNYTTICNYADENKDYTKLYLFCLEWEKDVEYDESLNYYKWKALMLLNRHKEALDHANHCKDGWKKLVFMTVSLQAINKKSQAFDTLEYSYTNYPKNNSQINDLYIKLIKDLDLPSII